MAVPEPAINWRQFRLTLQKQWNTEEKIRRYYHGMVTTVRVYFDKAVFWQAQSFPNTAKPLKLPGLIRNFSWQHKLNLLWFQKTKNDNEEFFTFYRIDWNTVSVLICRNMHLAQGIRRCWPVQKQAHSPAPPPQRRYWCCKDDRGEGQQASLMFLSLAGWAQCCCLPLTACTPPGNLADATRTVTNRAPHQTNCIMHKHVSYQ